MGRATKFILNPTLQEPSEEAHANIVEAMLHNDNFIVKRYKNHARVWCGECNSEENISFELLKQVKKASTCPFCHSQVQMHKEKWTYENDQLIRIGNAGHYYIVRKRINRKPFVYHKQVAIWNENGFYARNIYKSMYIWCFMSDRTINAWQYTKEGRDRMKKFRKRNTSSYNSLDGDFCAINNFIQSRGGFVEPTSRKEYLYNLILMPNMYKSNQKKLLMSYHLNPKQIEAVRIFDLKSYEQIYKYSSWINKQEFVNAVGKPLNVYYLDYLAKNKIDYMDYSDYIRQCETLNIKPGKPKDFYQVHAMLNSEIVIIKNKEKDDKIRRYAGKLMKKAYEKKDIRIRPLMDVEDIVSTGAQLHNCLKTYIDPYAMRKTSLFVLEDKGVKVVAIEVENNRLIQARANYNMTPESKYTRIINKWMEEAYA